MAIKFGHKALAREVRRRKAAEQHARFKEMCLSNCQHALFQCQRDLFQCQRELGEARYEVQTLKDAQLLALNDEIWGNPAPEKRGETMEKAGETA